MQKSIEDDELYRLESEIKNLLTTNYKEESQAQTYETLNDALSSPQDETFGNLMHYMERVLFPSEALHMAPEDYQDTHNQDSDCQETDFQEEPETPRPLQLHDNRVPEFNNLNINHINMLLSHPASNLVEIMSEQRYLNPSDLDNHDQYETEQADEEEDNEEEEEEEDNEIVESKKREIIDLYPVFLWEDDMNNNMSTSESKSNIHNENDDFEDSIDLLCSETKNIMPKIVYPSSTKK